MRVGDILRRKGARIGTVRLSETVAAALRLLLAEDSGALVVKDVRRTEDGTLVSVLSEREVVCGPAERGMGVLEQPVTVLMRRDPVCCRLGDSPHLVLLLMDEQAVRHVPVLDGATLVGIVDGRGLVEAQVAEAEAYAEESWDFPVAAHH